MTDYIKIISTKLNEICDYKAPRIPILPEVVDNEFVKDYLGSINSVPVGVEKETLNIATVNLRDKYIYNITGEDITSEPAFIQGFINNLLSIENSECIVFDTNSAISVMDNSNIIYATDTCEDALESFKKAHESNVPEKNTFVFLIGINSLLGKLDVTERDELIRLIDDSKNDGNIRIILIDTIDSIKNINFESWYKANTDLAEGIWLGNGIGNQFTLKVTTNARILRAEVAPGFGYVIRKGKAALIKLMSDE